MYLELCMNVIMMNDRDIGRTIFADVKFFYDNI